MEKFQGLKMKYFYVHEIHASPPVREREKRERVFPRLARAGVHKASSQRDVLASVNSQACLVLLSEREERETMAGEDGPSCWRRRRGMGLAVAALLCCLAGTARGDFEADQKECADTLTGLLTCLEYVEGTSKAPPPDCCSGLNQIVTKNLRCLCILIKDRNDPQMPFKVNATRARSLPGACKNPIDIFQCIGKKTPHRPRILLSLLLHLIHSPLCSRPPQAESQLHGGPDLQATDLPVQ